MIMGTKQQPWALGWQIALRTVSRCALLAGPPQEIREIPQSTAPGFPTPIRRPVDSLRPSQRSSRFATPADGIRGSRSDADHTLKHACNTLQHRATCLQTPSNTLRHNRDALRHACNTPECCLAAYTSTHRRSQLRRKTSNSPNSRASKERPSCVSTSSSLSLN